MTTATVEQTFCFGSSDMYSADFEECQLCPVKTTCEESIFAFSIKMETGPEPEEVTEQVEPEAVATPVAKSATFNGEIDWDKVTPKTKAVSADWLQIAKQIVVDKPMLQKDATALIRGFFTEEIIKNLHGAALHGYAKNILLKLQKQNVLTWDGKAKTEVLWKI